MKFLKTDTRVLMLLVMIGSIGGTFAIVQGLDLGANSDTSNVKMGALLTGNVKVTQLGPDGSIIAYRQSDNHIVEQGMEIIMSQVFGINGTYPGFYKYTGTHPVRYMQIGNGSTALYANNTNIADPLSTAGRTCGRTLATINNVTDGPSHGQPVGCEATNSCAAQMNVTATARFYGGVVSGQPGASFCSTNAIKEAGIFDNSTCTDCTNNAVAAGGLMFARNTFGSVNLGPLDTLQLDWEFTFTDS